MSAPMSMFEKMWREQTLCDALLNVAGTQFWAHKLVLCSCSTFFRYLFTHWSSPDDQKFDIPRVSADIMRIILDYAYTKVVHVTQENLIELFEAADFFDISEITVACSQAMAESLSPSSCITTWELTNKYYNPQLRNQAFLYILKHFEEVLANSKAFLSLSLENLCSIIVEDQLNVRDERIVFEAVLKWIGHAQERNKSLAHLLLKIRLALVPPEYFTQHVRHNILIQNDPACQAVVMQTIKLKQNARTRGSNALCSLFSNYFARPRLPQAVLLVIGDGIGLNSTIESYDNRAKCWVVVANCNKTPITYNHSTVFLHGSLYLIGGAAGHRSFSTTHKYDLAKHTWQTVAPMHTQRSHVGVALLDGFIYVMGGFNGEQKLNTAEKYFPDTNQWTMIAPMNVKRSGAGSTAYNRKIYIFGGFSQKKQLSTGERYNPLTNQWTMITGMSTKRCEVSVIAYSNEIYVLGGYNRMAPLNTMEAYNPKTNTWRLLPPMLTSRSISGIGVIEDKLYAVGENCDSGRSCSVESFDMKTRVWSPECNMIVSQMTISCSVVYDLPNMADYSAARASPPEE